MKRRIKIIIVLVIWSVKSLNSQVNKEVERKLPILVGCEKVEENNNRICFYEKLNDLFSNNLREDYLNSKGIVGSQEITIVFAYNKSKGLVIRNISTKNLILKNEVERVLAKLTHLVSSDYRNDNRKILITMPISLKLKKFKGKRIRPAKHLSNKEKCTKSIGDSQIEGRKFNLKDSLKYYKISDWKEGMRFKVCNPFRSRSLKVTPLDTLTNKIITFKRHEMFRDSINSIFEIGGKEFIGKTFNGSQFDDNDYSCYVEKLVYCGEVDIVKRLLLDKTFYLLKTIEEDDETYDKFTITNVRYYQNELPVIITCFNKQKNKTYNFSMFLSGTNISKLNFRESSKYYKICDFDSYFLSEEDFISLKKKK